MDIMGTIDELATSTVLWLSMIKSSVRHDEGLDRRIAGKNDPRSRRPERIKERMRSFKLQPK